MDELLAPFTRLLEQLCSPALIRRVESGVDDGSAWRELSESGFLDAMVPESEGGAGLAPSAVAPLFVACGQHLLPYAFAETMVARAIASTLRLRLPPDPIILWPEDEAGRLRSPVAPIAGGAAYALVHRGSRVDLRPVTRAKPDGFHIPANAVDLNARALLTFELPEHQVMNWAAALVAASMAGAMSRVLEMTLQHLDTRHQFDRPLARFQALQQQVSVMTEHVANANVAARMALARDLPGPNTFDAALGKTIADTAATVVTSVAHAAHGAIGITAEHDLSLYVRRLKRWQLSFGSAGYWATHLGASRLACTSGTSVDFLRAQRA